MVPSERPGAARRGRPGAARGSLTVEAALVVPTLLLVTAALATVLGVGQTMFRADNAAAVGAAALARGASPAAARAVAAQAAPAGSQVTVRRDAGVVVVVVRVDVPGGTLGGLLPPWPVRAQAAAVIP